METKITQVAKNNNSGEGVTETQKDSVDEQELLTCFECGDKMREGDAHIWYHGDQDDLICEDCARVTEHTDTAYAGMLVLVGEGK